MDGIVPKNVTVKKLNDLIQITQSNYQLYKNRIDPDLEEALLSIYALAISVRTDVIAKMEYVDQLKKGE